jgi:hypothetical protein
LVTVHDFYFEILFQDLNSLFLGCSKANDIYIYIIWTSIGGKYFGDIITHMVTFVQCIGKFQQDGEFEVFNWDINFFHML